MDRPFNQHVARTFEASSGLPTAWSDLTEVALLDAVRSAARSGVELRATRGRRTSAFAIEGRRLVAKCFVGDEPREWWYERLRGRPRDPAEREARALERAGSLGLRVPRPLVALAEGRPPRLVPPAPGRGAGAVLVTEWVEHDDHLGRRLAREPDERARRGWIAAAAQLVAALHRAGGYHRDLYASHLAIDPDGRLVLFDLGRCRFERAPRERWIAKDLGGLLGSFGDAVTPREALRFLSLWRRATVRRRSEARRVAERARAKARRLFAHVPIDPGTDRVGWPIAHSDDGGAGANATSAPDEDRAVRAVGGGR